MWLDRDDHNALVSPTMARAAIRAGTGLGSVAVRPHEFFNYYGFEYAFADSDQLAIATELYQPDLDPAGEWVMQVSVSADEDYGSDRPPAHLVLVVDGSSHADAAALDLVRDSVDAVASSLRFGDRVSILRLGDPNPVLLDDHYVQQSPDPALAASVADLQPGGDPQLEVALGTAYSMAFDVFDPFALNRVVYVGGDLGGAEPIPTDLAASYAGAAGEDGVLLVGAGLGDPGVYDPDLVAQLTAAGRGSSSFIDDSDEAWRVFGTEFVSTMALAAHDVSVRVELPPGFRPVDAMDAVHPSELPEVEANPQDLAANRPIVFHDRLETCAPENLDSNSQLEVFVTWVDAWSGEPRETSASISFGEAMEPNPVQLHKGRAVRAYARALIGWQDAESAADQTAAILAGLAVVEQALEQLPNDSDLLEMAELLATLY
jgi:Ca-activated chloride channel family protein